MQRLGCPVCRPGHKVHASSVMAGAFVATNGILKLQHPGFSDERTVPAVLLLAQAFPPGSRQLVEFRAAVVLRRVPVSLQQSLAHQSKQRGVEDRKSTRLNSVTQ